MKTTKKWDNFLYFYLPFFPLDSFVQSARVVSCNKSHELVKEYRRGEKSSPRGRAQHPEHSEEYRDSEHQEYLDTRTNHSSKQS